MISCVGRGHYLVGELQKGRVYYCCHNRDCGTRTVREDVVESAIHAEFVPLTFTEQEVGILRGKAAMLASDKKRLIENRQRIVRLELAEVSRKLAKLLDVFIGGHIDQQLFNERKLTLLMERTALEEEERRLAEGRANFPNLLMEYLELLQAPAAKSGSSP